MAKLKKSTALPDSVRGSIPRRLSAVDKDNLLQRCDRVYTKLVDIVYRVSCIQVHTRNFINTRKYIHEIFSLN